MRRPTSRMLALLILGAVINWAVAWALMLGVNVEAVTPFIEGAKVQWSLNGPTGASHAGGDEMGRVLWLSQDFFRWDSFGRTRMVLEPLETSPPTRQQIEQVDRCVPAWATPCVTSWRTVRARLEGELDDVKEEDDPEEWIRVRQRISAEIVATNRLRIEAAGWPMRAVWGGVVEAMDGRAWVAVAGPPIVYPTLHGAIFGPRADAETVHVNADGSWRMAGGSERTTILPVTPLWPGFIVNTLFYAAVLGLVNGGIGQGVRLYRHRRGRCRTCGYAMGQSSTCTECGNPR